MKWLEFLVSFAFDWLGSAISLIQQSPLSFLTFIGIIPTIVLGYSSMNHQRRNAGRESIEQLDDLYIGSHGKIKPILHKFPRWPYRHVTVKLKIYNPGQVAGVSRPLGSFLVFPRHVFDGYSFEAVSDGYILHIHSANPVEIRNSVEEIFDRMDQARMGNMNVEYQEFSEKYSASYQGEWVPVYDKIINELSYFSTTRRNRIESRLQAEGYDSSIVRCALSDLVSEGIIKEHSRQRYSLTADWDALFSLLLR